MEEEVNGSDCSCLRGCAPCLAASNCSVEEEETRSTGSNPPRFHRYHTNSSPSSPLSLQQRRSPGSLPPDHHDGQRSRNSTFAPSRLPSLVCLSWLVLASFFSTFPNGAAATKALPDLSRYPTPPVFTHEPNKPVVYFNLLQSAIPADGGTNGKTDLSNVKLPCKASGFPKVEYEWLKDGSPLDFENDPNIVMRDGEGTLIIKTAVESDAGEYQCRASNGNGTAIDAAIKLEKAYMHLFPKNQLTSKVQVNVGDPYTRSCSPHPPSNPKPRIYWIKKSEVGGSRTVGNFKTINSSHISMDDEGTIYFHYTDPETDAFVDTVFACTLENNELKDYKFGNNFFLEFNQFHDIRLTSPSVLKVSAVSQTALKGKDLTLHCLMAGYTHEGPYTPIWMFEGKQVVYGEKFEDKNHGKSIVIKNFTEADDGKYECIFDKAPQINREFNAKTEAAPYWPNGMPPPSQNSSESEVVTFNCKAEADPPATYEFFKNGKPLVFDNRVVKTHGGAGFTITNLVKGLNGKGDNAVYQCRVKNKHGQLWANFYLNLLSIPAMVLEFPVNIESIMSRPKTIKCKVFGSPMPTVQFTGKSIKAVRSKNTQPDRNGVATYTIKTPMKEMEGTVTCRAQNKYGDVSENGQLIVKEATRISLGPPKRSEFVAGGEVRLPCEVLNDPSLTLEIQWLKNGRDIPEQLFEDGQYQIDTLTNELVLPEATRHHSGNYTCVAKTHLDETQHEGEVIIQDVPGPPKADAEECPMKTDPGSVVITITHVERNNVPNPVKEFLVQYQVDHDTERNDWRTHASPIRNPKETYRGKFKIIEIPATLELNPFGRYRFRVIARNYIGDSAPSAVTSSKDGKELLCETPAVRPAKNPSGVKVVSNTQDNLVVKWNPMPREEWNGPEFHYLVDYRIADPTDPDLDPDVPKGDQRLIVKDPYTGVVIIDNQPMNTEYVVKVTAVNREGVATITPQEFVGKSGEGIPSVAVSGFDFTAKTATSVDFEWDSYDEKDANGEFKGYKIVHWFEEEGQGGSGRKKRSIAGEKKEAIFDKSSTGGTVYGMKPNKLNKAYIVPFNNANDGPKSPVLELRLPEGVPTSVRGLTVYPLSDNEVAVQWTKPRELNGDLKGFEVEYCDLKETDCPREAITNPEQDFFRVKNLKERQQYRITVRGKTDAGLGDPRSVIVNTLPATVKTIKPVQPGLGKAGIGQDHINITWIPGPFNSEESSPIGTESYVKYRLKGAKEWEKTEMVGGNLTATIEPLDPGTTYEVQTVSVFLYPNGTVAGETESQSHWVTTRGETPRSATAAWLIAIIIAIIILIIILIIVCLVVRNRSAKYPVAEKEREQGREPMLGKEEKGFSAYAQPGLDEEKRSLTGESKPESETDSLAQYGDMEAGNFGEDGSFIGQYGAPAKVLYAPGAKEEKSRPTTFV